MVPIQSFLQLFTYDKNTVALHKGAVAAFLLLFTSDVHKEAAGASPVHHLGSLFFISIPEEEKKSLAHPRDTDIIWTLDCRWLACMHANIRAYTMYMHMNIQTD